MGVALNREPASTAAGKLLSVCAMTLPASETLTPQLVNALRAVVGPEYVIAGEQELLVYECDACTLEKHPPGGGVLPNTTQAVIAICRKNGAREVRLAKTEQERADLWKNGSAPDTGGPHRGFSELNA